MVIDVSPERVRATADLARLDLRDDEVAPIAAQLQKILAHIAELDALDAPPLADCAPEGGATALRDDAPRPPLPRDEALSQAPRVEAGAFVVPQFVEE
ncbi:MAG: Asp-tRNA(Asn)/Glu-tRNA(Gln) amidotransferase subunit GatC [Polyangiales bacterium]